jgi:hypothetical protein
MTHSSFYPALELILVLSITLFSLNGIGSLSRFYFFGGSAGYRMSQNLIMGLCATSFFLELINLFFRIDWVASLFLILIGFFGSLRDFYLKNSLQFKDNHCSRIAIYIFPAILLLWALKAIDPIPGYDAGLYYLQSIRWLNEYPIIPGLGNLHDRLAFNQSSFGLVAILNFFPFWGKGYAVINLLLLSIALVALVEANLRKVYGGWWIQLFVFYGLVSSALGQLSNPSPDIAVAILEILVFMKMFKLFLENSSYKESVGNIDIYFLLVLLFTIKLSSAAFVAGCFLLLNKSLVGIYKNNKIIFIKIFIICVFATLIHLLRGYILSGAPLFPSKFGYISSLDWSMSEAEITNITNWIYSWARAPGKNPSEVLGNWSWFSLWYYWFKESWSYRLGIFAQYLTFLSFAALLLPKNIRPKWEMYLLFIPMVFTITLWFFTAPDIRFLGPSFILIIALSGWLTLYPTRSINFFGASTSKISSALQFFPKIICLSLAIIAIKTSTNKGWPVFPLPIGFSGWPTLPTIANDVAIKITDSGLSVITPRSDDRCQDAELPCTPYFSPDLKLRSESQSSQFLSSGFTKK